jgi:hypothetical protein
MTEENNNPLDPIHDLGKALAALIGEHLPAQIFNSDNVSEILRDEIRDVVRDEANGGSISDSLYDNISDCISECEIDSHQVYYGQGFYREVYNEIEHLIMNYVTELAGEIVDAKLANLEIVVSE